MRKLGVRVSLQPQPARILEMLIDRRGELVTRRELRDLLWSPNIFVDYDHSINRSVNRLRQVLSDSADDPRYIETIPGRGYRFIASVDEALPEEPRVSQPDLPPDAQPLQHGAPLAVPRGRWLAVGAVALILLTGTISAILHVQLWTPEKTDKKMRIIAVLPVANLTGDPGLEYLVDGLTDAVIAELSRQDGSIAVISRTAVAPYKSTTKSPQEIAGELGADYLLESSLEKSGSRFRMTAKLIDPSKQTGVWSQTFDRVEMDRLDFERDIAVGLANQTTLGFAQPRKRPHLENADARREYQIGIFLRDTRKPEEWGLAEVQMQSAISKDPRYAEAYEALSNIHWLSPAFPGYDLPKAEEYARKAIELDPDSAEAHAQLGGIYSRRDQWKLALDELAVAAKLQPNSMMMHYVLANTLRESGRPKEAIPEFERVLQIAPTYANGYANAALAFADIGDFERSDRLIQRSLELNPNSVVAFGNEALIMMSKHHYAEALEQFRKAFEVGHENTYKAAQAFCLGRLGRAKEAEGIALWFEGRPKTERFHSNHLFLVYSGLGQPRKAVQQLREMIKQPGDREWLDTPNGMLYIEPIKDSPEYLEFRRELDSQQLASAAN